MTVTVYGPETKLDLNRMTVAEAGSLRFVFPSAPSGTWTFVGGPGHATTLTLATDGVAKVLSWTADQATHILGAKPYRIRQDGHTVFLGQNRASEGRNSPTDDPITVVLGNGDTVTVEAVVSGGGVTLPIDAEDVTVPNGTMPVLGNLGAPAPENVEEALSTLDYGIGYIYGLVAPEAGAKADLQALELIRGQADIATTPVAWLECGGSYTGSIGGETDAWWRCSTVLPSPTSTLRIRTMSRHRRSSDLVSDDTDFQETYSESKDSNGVPGAGGGLDRFEKAKRWDGVQLREFWEHLPIGDSEEISYADPLHGVAHPVPWGRWIEDEVEVDMAAGTVTYRVRVDAGWDHYDEDTEDRWRTTRVYEIPAGSTSIEASDGLEQWIGRGEGAFDVARVRRWDDGVLVLDADPSTGDDGDTLLTDSVMAADWTASGGGTNVLRKP